MVNPFSVNKTLMSFNAIQIIVSMASKWLTLSQSPITIFIYTFVISYSKMLARKVLKDSLSKDANYWDFIGRLLASCQQSDVLKSDTLQNVCLYLIIIHLSLEFDYVIPC